MGRARFPSGPASASCVENPHAWQSQPGVRPRGRPHQASGCRAARGPGECEREKAALLVSTGRLRWRSTCWPCVCGKRKCLKPHFQNAEESVCGNCCAQIGCRQEQSFQWKCSTTETKTLKHFFKELEQKLKRLYQHDPEDQAQSKQRLARSGSSPVKTKVNQWRAKVVAVVFWGNAQGVLLVDFLKHQRMITTASWDVAVRKPKLWQKNTKTAPPESSSSPQQCSFLSPNKSHFAKVLMGYH